MAVRMRHAAANMPVITIVRILALPGVGKCDDGKDIGAACGARLEHGGVHKAQGHVGGVGGVLGADRARAGLAPPCKG
eukprot:scaffold34512_cov63-Phaeocystis_antarctica.AAC.2